MHMSNFLRCPENRIDFTNLHYSSNTVSVLSVYCHHLCCPWQYHRIPAKLSVNSDARIWVQVSHFKSSDQLVHFHYITHFSIFDVSSQIMCIKQYIRMTLVSNPQNLINFSSENLPFFLIASIFFCKAHSLIICITVRSRYMFPSLCIRFISTYLEIPSSSLPTLKKTSKHAMIVS